VRWLAKLLLLYAPGWLKARACREMSAEFTALAVAAAEANSDSCAWSLRGAAREAGARAGERLTRDLRLDGSFEDAELAWRIVCKFSGMKIAVERRSDRAVFNHLACPLFEAGGESACEGFCLPFVEGFTEAVCPACTVALVERPAAGHPCRKALVHGGGGE
jgi:hypothetical protein